MATRGRKAKAAELKVLHGERADRLPPLDSPPAVSRPECPDHLDEDAREEWGRITADLESLGILSRADRMALTIYCNAYSRWRRARRETLDIIASTDLGSPKSNPAVAVEREAESTMLRILSEFGLTPASRSRVKAGGDDPEKDDLGEFLARRKG